MAQLNVWKCDICKNEFRTYENSSVEISMDWISMYDQEYIKNFKDVCLSCRAKIKNFFSQLIVDDSDN